MIASNVIACVDRDMWAQIVLNLLSNALKHTFTGSVSVALRADSDAVELSVTDTGIGIAPEQLARLFDRFHRVPGARSRSHEGSGIGLALVAELAAVHGGVATVTSTVGAGSSFRVRLPRGDVPTTPMARAGSIDPRTVQQHSRAHLAEAMRWSADLVQVGEEVSSQIGGQADVAAPTKRPSAMGLGPDAARVLVVDDNVDMRRYVAGLLADLYAVDTAADGVEALRALESRRADLVLTDVMMPHLDGFGLLDAMRRNPSTADIPVIMVSARSGDDATVEGLDAGADDYLVKPFAARELRARVRANLELDRTRRATAQLERYRLLLDQAQRLAGVGSWEIDVSTGQVTASEELARQVGRSVTELASMGFEAALSAVVDPRDTALLREALEAAQGGQPLDIEVRLQHDGGAGTYRILGGVHRDDTTGLLRLSGSTQDVTEQRRAVELQAAAAAAQQAAAHEHAIAEQLQLSLLPARWFDPDHLHIATYYRAGVEGTHVGGDWYDVIELGAGRVGLVIGDVMGRGVPAAAIMGQLRSAVRAFSRLDLPPADLLELMDGLVRDLGDDQIVTCLYAVYDPGERSLTYANAGHLPPLLATPHEPATRLTSVAGPPLGTGPFSLVEERIVLHAPATLALYTDGLVERRDIDIDHGINALAAQLARIDPRDPREPARLVDRLLPDGPDDDIAVLLVSVADEPLPTSSRTWRIPNDVGAVSAARANVAEILRGWQVSSTTIDDIVLAVSELATNALLHAQPPIELRLRQGRSNVVLEVHDHSPVLPRKHRPGVDDEHGRGLLLLSQVAQRWGTRPTGPGKAVWGLFRN